MVFCTNNFWSRLVEKHIFRFLIFRDWRFVLNGYFLLVLLLEVFSQTIHFWLAKNVYDAGFRLCDLFCHIVYHTANSESHTPLFVFILLLMFLFGVIMPQLISVIGSAFTESLRMHAFQIWGFRLLLFDGISGLRDVRNIGGLSLLKSASLQNFLLLFSRNILFHCLFLDIGKTSSFLNFLLIACLGFSCSALLVIWIGFKIFIDSFLFGGGWNGKTWEVRSRFFV